MSIIEVTHTVCSAEEYRLLAEYLIKSAELAERNRSQEAPHEKAPEKAPAPSRRRETKPAAPAASEAPTETAPPAPAEAAAPAAPAATDSPPPAAEPDGLGKTHDDIRLLMGKLAGTHRAESVAIVRSFKTEEGKGVNGVSEIRKEDLDVVWAKLKDLSGE